MADAWDTLVAGSIIPEVPGNDAWDHLINQGGGTGPGANIYILANVAVTAEYVEEDVEVSAAAIRTVLPAEGDIEVEVEVQDVQPAIDITATAIDIDNPDEIEV